MFIRVTKEIGGGGCEVWVNREQICYIEPKNPGDGEPCLIHFASGKVIEVLETCYRVYMRCLGEK